jgi:hypothetical protein
VISLCGSIRLTAGGSTDLKAGGGATGLGAAGVGGIRGFGAEGTEGVSGLGADGIGGVENEGLAGAGGKTGGLGGAPLGLFSTGRFGGRLSGIIKISISRPFLTGCE